MRMREPGEKPFLGAVRADFVPNPKASAELGPMPVLVTGSKVKGQYARPVVRPSASSQELFRGSKAKGAEL